MTILRRCAAAVAVVLAIAACESSDPPNHEEVATPGTSSEVSGSSGADASMVADGVVVRATAAPGDRDRELTIKAADTLVPGVDARVAATAPVSVELDGGAVQPSAPMQLVFDLAERPDLVAAFTGTVRPVVESVSATDPDDRDMFPAVWDPVEQTVTAEVTHLTNFWVGAFDVLKAIETGVGRVFDTLVRGDSTSPCREKSGVTIGETLYELTVVSPGAVAGCLVGSGGAPAVELENATGSFYSVMVAPGSVGGQWLVTQPLSMDDAAASMIASLIPNSKGVLAGRSAGRLTLKPGITQADVRLTPQPQGILVKSLVSAVGMLGIDLKRFQDIPQAWDCFVTGLDIGNVYADVNPAKMQSMIGGVAQCLIAMQDPKGNPSRSAALHRLSVATALLTELPRQLSDFVASGLQEAARDSVKDFQLRTMTQPAQPGSPIEGPAAGPVIDRVEVTTWAYDRVQGDTYIADNTGAKRLEVQWKSFAGVDTEVRSGCKSIVRIQGPATDETTDGSRCFSSNPGTSLTARSPGVHTVTVTVQPEGQPPITQQRTVTILPHN